MIGVAERKPCSKRPYNERVLVCVLQAFVAILVFKQFIGKLSGRESSRIAFWSGIAEAISSGFDFHGFTFRRIGSGLLTAPCISSTRRPSLVTIRTARRIGLCGSVISL